MRILESYTKGGLYDFPKRRINPKKKDEKEYSIDNCKAIYSLYVRGLCSHSKDMVDYIKLLRAYANGKQPTDQYKDMFLGNSSGSSSSNDFTVNPTTGAVYDNPDGGSKNAKRSGYVNIDFDKILTPAPKIVSAFHGMLDEFDFDIKVNMIDSESRYLMEHKKMESYLKGKFQQWEFDFRRKGNLRFNDEAVYPSNKEELDMMELEDGYKLNIAIAMEKLIEHSFNVSKWDNIIKRNFVDDLVIIGRTAGKNYFDIETGEFKTKYVDPKDVFLQWSDQFDYSDSEYGGVFVDYTVSNLKYFLPDITEEEWSDMAYSYSGYRGNPTESDFNDYAKYNSRTNTWGYDSYKISVLECQWLDEDVSKKTYYVSPKGSEKVIPMSFDDEYKEPSEKAKKMGAKSEYIEVNNKYTREACWIVGTDHVFGNGRVNFMNRPNKNKPGLDLFMIQILQPSVIERILNALDEYARVGYSYQNSMAKMIENGYAINFGMLMNVSDGQNGTIDPFELLEMMKETGFLPFSYSYTGDYKGGGASPIIPIKGGMGERIAETIQAISMWNKFIEEETGINPLALGSTPDPDAPVKTSQMALQSTNKNIATVINALFNAKEEMANIFSRRLQYGIKTSDLIRKTYSSVIDEVDIEYIHKSVVNGSKYGLEMVARPTQAHKDKISAYIQASLRSGNITHDQAMYYEELIDRGINMSEIRRGIKYSIKKNKEEERQHQLNMIREQGAQNQNAAKVKMDADAYTERIKGQREIAVNDHKIKLEIQRDNQKAGQDLYQKLLDQKAEEERAEMEVGNV